MECSMECSIRTEMKKVCRGKDWRKAIDLLESGYKGIYVILRILSDSDAEIVSADLAKLLNVSTARIATALNTLERKGYLERTPSSRDGRKVVIMITPLGTEALAAREEEVNGFVGLLFAKLTEEEQETFFALLKKLLQ